MYAFVYGTLRKGDSRFGVLDGCECIAAEAYLDDFQMLHLGGFPGIIHGAGRVRGVALGVDALVPVVVRQRRILRLDRFEPHVLARRLVEVTMDTDVATVHEPALRLRNSALRGGSVRFNE